jgi:hypothetical protein
VTAALAAPERPMTQPEQAPDGVDPDAEPARMYDYMLNGKRFQPTGTRWAVPAQLPDLEDAAWANRAFHQRAAR